MTFAKASPVQLSPMTACTAFWDSLETVFPPALSQHLPSLRSAKDIQHFHTIVTIPYGGPCLPACLDIKTYFHWNKYIFVSMLATRLYRYRKLIFPHRLYQFWTSERGCQYHVYNNYQQPSLCCSQDWLMDAKIRNILWSWDGVLWCGLHVSHGL